MCPCQHPTSSPQHRRCKKLPQQQRTSRRRNCCKLPSQLESTYQQHTVCKRWHQCLRTFQIRIACRQQSLSWPISRQRSSSRKASPSDGRICHLDTLCSLPCLLQSTSLWHTSCSWGLQPRSTFLPYSPCRMVGPFQSTCQLCSSCTRGQQNRCGDQPCRIGKKTFPPWHSDRGSSWCKSPKQDQVNACQQRNPCSSRLRLCRHTDRVDKPYRRHSHSWSSTWQGKWHTLSCLALSTCQQRILCIERFQRRQNSCHRGTSSTCQDPWLSSVQACTWYS